MKRMGWRVICVCALCAWGSAGSAQTNEAIRVRDFMTPDQFQASGLYKLSTDELDSLDEWFAAAMQLVRLGAKPSGIYERPSTLFPIPPVRVGVNAPILDFQRLLGARVVAADGRYLGKVIRSATNPESVVNPMGDHGSESKEGSLSNRSGPYGSYSSNLSAFDSSAESPPSIYMDKEFVAFLTLNQKFAPRVDPHALISWLRLKQ
jgi:hypothetical protein